MIMEELMIVANVAIVFGVIYKLFELFVKRKERMMLIEKMGDKLTPEVFKNGIFYLPSSFSFGGLRLGCLLLGLGLGLLVGYVIVCLTGPERRGYRVSETISIIYGASVLLGGGLGLVVSYLIEVNKVEREKEEK